MTETKNIKPLEDFDWEAFEHGKNPANIAEETKAYEGTLNNVNDNEVVAVFFGKRFVYVLPVRCHRFLTFAKDSLILCHYYQSFPYLILILH